MKIIDFENLVKQEIQKIVEKIIQGRLNLPISAQSRAGAEISTYLEEEFVKNFNLSNYIVNAEAAPQAQTKNPWDAKCEFKVVEHKEQIWIDFKAIKITGIDSNPDIGTPNKIIKFIENGSFYLLYVFVYYEQENQGLKFVQNPNGEYVKVYFLKDVSSSVRRNPKNQLQVNINEPPEYRSREDFITMLIQKLKESHERQIKISKKELLVLDHVKDRLIDANNKSETIIKKI